MNSLTSREVLALKESCEGVNVSFIGVRKGEVLFIANSTEDSLFDLRSGLKQNFLKIPKDVIKSLSGKFRRVSIGYRFQ